MNKSNNERYNTHDAGTVFICVLFSKFTFYPSSSVVHSFLLLNKCGAYALPHQPPHQPHHHPHMQSSCLNVCVSVCASGFSVCVFYVCVCLFVFLTVCCRHLEPSKKRNIAEVCFGKSKRKLTAEGGGKLKWFFFPLSSLVSLSFSNYAAGSVLATRKSRGNPFAMQIVTKKGRSSETERVKIKWMR